MLTFLILFLIALYNKFNRLAVGQADDFQTAMDLKGTSTL